MVLIVARVGGRPAPFWFLVQGCASAVAVDVDFEDGGVVNDAVDGGERHREVREMRPHSPNPALAVISMEWRS